MSLRDADIETLVAVANEVTAQIKTSFGSLTVEQLNWKPGPDRWSIAQCLDHLFTASETYFSLFESVRGGRHKSVFLERLPILPGLWAKLMVKYLEPTSTLKLKAPKNFRPSQSEVRGTIVEDFSAQQNQLIDYMESTEGLHPEGIIITSPAASFVTYSLLDAYRIVVVHEQRHLLQAKRVMDEKGFPLTPHVHH